MKELYGIDLPFQVRIGSRTTFFAVRVPGWVNFGLLRQTSERHLKIAMMGRQGGKTHGVA